MVAWREDGNFAGPARRVDASALLAIPPGHYHEVAWTERELKKQEKHHGERADGVQHAGGEDNEGARSPRTRRLTRRTRLIAARTLLDRWFCWITRVTHQWRRCAARARTPEVCW